MKASRVSDLRQAIYDALDTGSTPSQAAARAGCARQTVYNAIAARQRGPTGDRRHRNRGRPKLYGEAIAEAVLRARAALAANGGRMLAAQLARDPGRWGLDPLDVPSPATIDRLIHARGLARKPVGPRDNRRYPDPKPTEPGVITIDTWGPWHVRASRLYLATVQDRVTRLTAAVPSTRMEYPGSGAVVGFSTQTWAAAIEVARLYLTNGALSRVYADNGVGLIPAFGTLPRATRHALALGARVVFIPPAQPWRNGKLERMHWSMETEYFRREQPRTIPAALIGLTAYFNYMNHFRPHGGLQYRAPADVYPWAIPLPENYWDVAIPPYKQPVPGVVEVLRIVYNDGRVDLWGHALAVPLVLAGQYVRVRLFITGGIAPGEVLYELLKGEELVVATFTHALDALGHTGPDCQLIRDVSFPSIDVDQPLNQRLDMHQLANQQSRVMKRRSSLDRELAQDGRFAEPGDQPANGGAG